VAVRSRMGSCPRPWDVQRSGRPAARSPRVARGRGPACDV